MFDWDEHNDDHIARQGRTHKQVEQMLLSEDRLEFQQGLVNGERRFAVIGPTDDGRTIVAIYTHRLGRIRVVTARDPSARELALYRRHMRRR